MSGKKMTRGVISVLLAVWSPLAQASSSVKFGDELLQRGQFQLASLEFQRALVDQPENSPVETADKALQAMWLSRDYKASADLAEYYSRKFSKQAELNCVSKYYLGISYYGLKSYPRAQSELSQSQSICSEPYISRSIYWNGLGSMRAGKFADARHLFGDISVGSLKVRDAAAALNSVDVAESLPRKSPRRAGLLNALVPGSGYAYAGYPQTGVASFLTIGLFTWGTIAAAQKGETALAVILGSLNLAWYFGGIQGAANAATRTNEGRLNAVIKPLEIN